MRKWALAGLAIVLTVAGTAVATSDVGATTAGSPVGRLDSVRVIGGNLVISGWSLDRDHLTSESVDIYQTAPNRTFRGRVSTTRLRSDVNRTQHVSGNHGWTFTAPAFPGRQTWCAYALNVGRGANTALGCLTVTVPSPQPPEAELTTATQHDAAVTLTGYAFDRDDLQHPEPVDVYEMKPAHKLVSRVLTTIDRPDVNSTYHVTGRHGFSVDEPVPASGSVQYCLYAINVGVAFMNPNFGCVTESRQPGSIVDSSVTTTTTSATLTFTVVASAAYPKVRITRVPFADVGFPWVTGDVVADLPVGTGKGITFTDTGLLAGQEYAYRLALHNDTASLDPSNPITATTPKAPCTATVCDWGFGNLVAGPAGPPYSLLPVPVSELGSDVTAVAAAQNGGSALRSDGTVLAWGPVLGQTHPTAVDGFTGVVAIADSGRAYYAVKTDGTLWTWGWDFERQAAGTTPVINAVPHQLPGVTGITSIVAGQNDVYALASDGTVWATGGNQYGALGEETTTDYLHHVAGLSDVVELGAARDSGYALKADGTVWSWGGNAEGELGIGSVSDHSAEPQQIPGLSGVRSLSSGTGGWELAVRTDGSLLAWGSDTSGQLGDGRTGVVASSPIPVPGITDVEAVATSGADSLAIRSDRTVSAWGASETLGNGSEVASLTPQAVYGLSDVRQLAAFTNFVLALRQTD